MESFQLFITSFLNNQRHTIFMETITIPKKQFDELKSSESNINLLKQLKESLKDIKEGRIKRVR